MSKNYDLQLQFETEHNKYSASSQAKTLARDFTVNNPSIIEFMTSYDKSLEYKANAFVISPLAKAVELCLINGEVSINYMFGSIVPMVDCDVTYAVNLITLAVENDLLDYDLDTHNFKFGGDMHPEDLIKMGKFEFPYPSVCPLKKLTSNFSNGSITGKAGRSFIISRADPDGLFYIGDTIFHEAECDFNLSNINRLNQVACRINTFPLEQIEDKVRERKPFEPGYKYEEYRRQKDLIVKFRGSIAEEIGDRDIYFMHYYDSRGRNYPVGYQFNPQGKDYDKSLITFANRTRVPAGTQLRDPSTLKSTRLSREFVTFNSLEYLAIHISNLAGHDKKTYAERLSWFQKVFASQDTAFTYLFDDVTRSMDSYASLAAASMEYLDIINGDSDSYGTIVQFDATASGPQLIGVILRSIPDAQVTNVVADSVRHDLYTALYKNFVADPMVAQSIDSDFDRKAFKEAVIPWFYGSSMVKDHLPENTYEIFVEVAEKIIPAVVKFMRHFTRPLPEGVTEYGWIMPDGFTVHCTVRESCKQVIRFYDAYHSISYKADKRYDKYHKGVAPNIIHSFDGFSVREVVSALNLGPETMSSICDKLNGFTATDSVQAELREQVLVLIRTSRRSKVFRHGLKLLSLAQECGYLSVEFLHDLTRNKNLWPVVQLLIEDPKASAKALHHWASSGCPDSVDPYLTSRSPHDNFAGWFDLFNEFKEALNLIPRDNAEALKAVSDISTIHDCFGGNGFNMNCIRKLYNLNMVRFCESWLLEKVHKDIYNVTWNELTPNDPLVKGNLTRKMIINSNYSLT